MSDDSVGTVVVASGGVNVPSINTRAIETQVVLERRPDRGARRHSGDHAEPAVDTKVPWLGDIPVLGQPVQEHHHDDDKDELLIFITPKILREGVSVN